MCANLCPDDGYTIKDGTSFISKIGGVSNINVPAGGDASRATERAFKCLALIGDNGCGIEGQLEGVRRALDGHNPQNAGFLRKNSLLAVVLLTDEDDCSVQLSRRAENDPMTLDCAYPDPNASYTCFNPDYRCMARDLKCDQAMNTPGAKTGCVERADSYLEPIATYAKFLGGLRPANRLLLSGIWSPSLDRGGKLVVTQRPGFSTSDGLNRDEQASAGCVFASDPTVTGRAQLRLSKLASRFSGSLQISVCDVDNYPRALDNLAAAITRRLGL